MLAGCGHLGVLPPAVTFTQCHGQQAPSLHTDLGSHTGLPPCGAGDSPHESTAGPACVGALQTPSTPFPSCARDLDAALPCPESSGVA